MTKKENKKQELQKKLLQFQILNTNLQILAERQNHLAQRFAEIEDTRQALEDLKSVKAGDSIMVPLGSGNFVSGEIKNCERVLVGFGAGVAIKKSQEEAIKIMGRRSEELNSALKDLDSQMRQIEFELTKLQAEIQELSREKEE